MKCKKCGYKGLREQPIFELYNKNGEFVEGFGHSPVWIATGAIEYMCEGCGFIQSRSLLNVLPRPPIRTADSLQKDKDEAVIAPTH